MIIVDAWVVAASYLAVADASYLAVAVASFLAVASSFLAASLSVAESCLAAASFMAPSYSCLYGSFLQLLLLQRLLQLQSQAYSTTLQFLVLLQIVLPFLPFLLQVVV